WEALTDWLLAGRALLGDLDAPGDEALCQRLAAICAAPGERDDLVQSLRDTVTLERAAVAGRIAGDPGVEGLVEDLGGSLRAILRDVLCGHLDPSLRTLADTILAEAGEPSVP
ncbi:MAG: hypothetical protein M3O90_03690, partial [Actinomycetota bacterium]|nr:hypothetical protein [Actinomycetota bacterium]